MSIASYIKVIGRGHDGARALDRAQAHDLLSQVLDGRVSDLEIGAFALAMRIKGESVAELAGFLDAVHERCIAIRSDRVVVVLPSYNGSRRLPNLTALLALLLAREGIAVLVHGPLHEVGRVTTAEVFAELGVGLATSAGQVEAAWRRGAPAFIAIDTLCPPLARLLAVRAVVGVRNSGHTVAKLLAAPAGAATLRVVNHTHPEYGVLLAGLLTDTGADAVLMRGTEGEPVADARRLQRLDVYLGGVFDAALSLAGREGVLGPLPVAPGTDAATTARTIESIVAGALAPPAPVAAQAACLARAVAALSGRDRQPAMAPGAGQ